MAEVSGPVLDALRAIQRSERLARTDFDDKISKLVADFHNQMDELADERLGVLTDPTALNASAKVKMTDVELCFNEMSLQEISGSNRPVDERYQRHGTAAWPRFWLHALLGCSTVRRRISTFDRQLLSYLRDVRCRAVQDDPQTDAFELEFAFAENPFFSNVALTRTFRLSDATEAEGELRASPIQWKDNTASLIEDLPSVDSCDEYAESVDANNARGSFFDVFQPFSGGEQDDLLDFKLLIAIGERVCCDPLKYALRYEHIRRGEETDDLTETDDDDDDSRPGPNDVGGRYPFSWLFG